MRAKKVSRSIGGNILVILLLGLTGIFMVLPLYLTVINAFKPLSELFVFPPRFYVVTPTTDNFSDMVNLLQSTRVPFERYLFNSLFITIVGTVGYIFIASLAAYPLAKHKFGGKILFVNLVVWAMLFRGEVLAIPQYLIIANLGWLNTYWAVIVPALASSMGVFLMRQFMEAFIPDSLLEAAKIDGAGEWRMFFSIVMPMVKPAWLTLTLLTFQSLWNQTGSTFIYNEEMKVLPIALSQIATSGIARAGVAAAVALFLLIPPVVVFIFSQKSVMQTMATSGIK
ncbi:MAG: carbohydrate ABC transporter permease [Oscillospiraceae bacterium]|nr:carbohydrate ABC transporter permease [Oscillospiraceae bacterium]